MNDGDGGGGQGGSKDEMKPTSDPALLFLREKDFLSALHEAVATEEREFGTIQTHYATSSLDKSTQVKQIISDHHDVAAAEEGDNISSTSSSSGYTGSLLFEDGSTSSPAKPYHLIVGADGMESTL